MALVVMYDTFEDLEKSVGYHLKFYDTSRTVSGYRPNGRVKVNGVPSDFIRVGRSVNNKDVKKWLAQMQARPIEANAYPWRAHVIMERGIIKDVFKT